MCGFNRRMPRMANNCCVVVVPAIPIQAGIGGMPIASGVAPVMPDMASNCLPNAAAMGGVMPNAAAANCLPAGAAMGGVAPNVGIQNNVVPSGTMPAGNLSGFTCNANFETTQCVMEQPLQCAPTIIHHHNRVQHMVPCVKTNIHHVHNHHEWLPFEQSEVNEVVNHTHGVRPSDMQLCNSVR